MPRTYEQIMPPCLADDATLLVQLSGVAEVVGGLGVLSRRTRGPAGVWLITSTWPRRMSAFTGSRAGRCTGGCPCSR
jgi:hypothetical protein